MRRALTIALALAAALGGAALAQEAPDGGADTGAADAYAAQSRQGFYEVEARIAALEAKAQALGPAGRRPLAEIRSIKAFAAQQKARHGGELRDWDREELNLRLDRVVSGTPSLAG